MRLSDVEILIVPGWTNSGPDHWQTRWQARLKTARRVEQTDWARPDCKLWTEAVVAAALEATLPVVIVAHSCGVATVAHAAQRLHADKVLGAFLVSPSSEATTAAIAGIDPTFVPFPRDPLPFPSLLVASRNDPMCAYSAAGDMALDWGSTLVDAGDVGHINTASGHGPWPEGAMRFGWFLKTLGKVREDKA
jgi:uncharacterized protein